MTIPIYTVAADTYVPMLKSLVGVLEKAAEFEKHAKLDLVHAKLAPDMYDLAQQVQESCFYAADAAARLTGKSEAERGELQSTFGGLIAQVKSTLKAFQAAPAAAFNAGEKRDCSQDMDEKMVIQMDGQRYLLGWSLPLFYFHVVTAYDILRHSGLKIGVNDFNSQVAGFIRPKGV